VEHVMTAVRALCENVLVMNAGREIARGRTSSVLDDPIVREAYLGRDDAGS
jgi:ABC-type branched-subunit amino acid transport system ATPase component